MASTTVSQFKQLFPATATPSKLLAEKVTVKLKLKNDWGSHTIKDLTKLVEFDVLVAISTSLKLKKVASQSSGCVLLLKSSSSRWPYWKLLVHSRPWECCRYSLERRSLCWNALTLPPQVVCASVWRSRYCGNVN